MDKNYKAVRANDVCPMCDNGKANKVSTRIYNGVCLVGYECEECGFAWQIDYTAKNRHHLNNSGERLFYK